MTLPPPPGQGAIVVDASVWVSRYVNQDVNHKVSYLWLERHFRAGGVVVGPMLLLAEVAGPVARLTGDVALAHSSYRQLVGLPNFRVVPIDRRLGLTAARLAADLGLRGADAAYVALAQALKLSLITWDEQQLQRGSAVVSTTMPGI